MTDGAACGWDPSRTTRRRSAARCTGSVPDLQFERVLDRLWISNGIDWSLDDTKMYFVDSPTRRVDVLDYDIETGAATNRRPFHEFADDVPGIPDGLCVDAEGGLWVALWGGSRVVGLTPDGDLHTHVDVPSSQVTSCAFGGPDLKTLFITSATWDLAPEVLERGAARGRAVHGGRRRRGTPADAVRRLATGPPRQVVDVLPVGPLVVVDVADRP